MDDITKEALSEKDKLMTSMKTIIISTINDDSIPNSSYAPAAIDEDGYFYIYISKLSQHTRNLLKNSMASLMIIEDESKSENIFARKRFTINASAEVIERESSLWFEKIQILESKFGESLTFLKKLTDFHLFKIEPKNGLLVYGFARAFKFKNKKLDQIVHMNDQGHTTK